jgi:hypothetical protein
MTQEEFNQWCVNQSLSNQARIEIEKIRNTCPSRSVGSRCKNVSGRYPSRKMGVTIQFELCNTLSTQQLQDTASIVMNALYNKI